MKVLNEFELVEDYYSNIILSDCYFDFTYGIRWNYLNCYLNKEFLDFKKILSIYLAECVPILYLEKEESVPDTVSEQLKSINPDHIITFNYTDYYKKYYNCESIIHIHGSLEDSNIILGYEDDNPEELEFIRFKKYF